MTIKLERTGTGSSIVIKVPIEPAKSADQNWDTVFCWCAANMLPAGWDELVAVDWHDNGKWDW